MQIIKNFITSVKNLLNSFKKNWIAMIDSYFYSNKNKEESKESKDLNNFKYDYMYFLKVIQEFKYNLDYELENEDENIIIYKYNYESYLKNPKILNPELIINKTFIIQVKIQDEDLTRIISIDYAQVISDYYYILKKIRESILNFESKYQDIIILEIYISVWIYKGKKKI